MTNLRFCEACSTRLPSHLFSPHRGHFDGLHFQCDPCREAAKAARRAISGKPASSRPSVSVSVSRGVKNDARFLELVTGVRHAVDHIVPLVSPLVQSMNGPNRLPPSRFVGPLIPLVRGLHVPANLRPLDVVSNSSKSNRWWPDMPDHPELLAAKARFDRRQLQRASELKRMEAIVARRRPKPVSRAPLVQKGPGACSLV